MIINDLDGYYIVFDTKNWNTELDTLFNNKTTSFIWYCLPDSRPAMLLNPETSSRVTLASLGTVFQTGLVV